MKRISPSEDRPRFRASIRHYHRSNTSQDTAWKQWVDGLDSPFARKKGTWTRVLVILCVLVAFGAITAGVLGLKLG